VAGHFFGESARAARNYHVMGPFVEPDSQELDVLRQASRGDAGLLQSHLMHYRGRLLRMVKLRIDPRVRGRVDPSDVVQEAYLEVSRKLADYLRDPQIPFFLWLRLLTGQKLALAHRHHLGVQARDAGREISLFHGAYPEASSAALAARLMGNLTSPSQAAVKAELKVRVQEALNGMDPIDREVLTLRHFEQLSNAEAALVLGIKETAAANRYVRALERLRGVLSEWPGEGRGGA
jgi:RNA polymerase sigma-70 factor (ECF subfamily)